MFHQIQGRSQSASDVGMIKRPAEDVVGKWQRLMLRWQAAQMSHRAAVEAAQSLDSLATVGQRLECDSAEQRAFSEMQEIKRQIDELIKDQASRRKPEKGILVVGTIQKKLSKAKEQDVQPKTAGRSKRTKDPY